MGSPFKFLRTSAVFIFIDYLPANNAIPATRATIPMTRAGILIPKKTKLDKIKKAPPAI
jgi:hypothetical protein